MNILGPVMIVQLILIGIILAVLKKFMEFKFVELAIRAFEFWELEDYGELPPQIDVSVTTHKVLPPKKKQRILQASLKHFGPNAHVVFQEDRSMLAGMIIKFDKEAIEYCLRDRLIAGGMMKVKK